MSNQSMNTQGSFQETAIRKARSLLNSIRSLVRKIGWFYTITATGCFSGFSPFASGTAGTAAAIPLYLLLVKLGWLPYIIATIILFVIGIPGAAKIEIALGRKDPKIVVIDEVVGYLITMAFLPQNWLFVIAGFFVFRLFDIWKPYPIRALDENPNFKGFGVMVDDALAGVYGNIVLQIAAMLLSTSK